MPAPRSFHRLGEVAQKWSELAEKRLAHFADLHCSGRWRHYHAENEFLDRLQEAARLVELWADVVANLPKDGRTSEGRHSDERQRAAA